MAAFSIVSYMKGILRRKGFTVTDYPFTEDEAQQAEEARQTLRKVIDACKIGGGFLASKDESCDCFVEVRLPQYCTTSNGKDKILLKVDMASILADRAAAIVKDRGTEI